MQRSMIQAGLAGTAMLLALACSGSPSGPGNGNPGVGNDPLASFTLTPTTPDVVDTVFVDASASSDVETGPDTLAVRWDWENDGTYDTGYSTTKTAAHQYLTGGSFTISLEVMDADGNTATTTRSVTITRNIAGVTVSPGSASVANGFTRQFNTTITDGNGNSFSASRSWSVTSATMGSIESNGLFTAGTSSGVSGWVVATAGGIKDSSEVDITPQAISYASDLASSFLGTCAQSGCHDSGTKQNNLDLSSYAGLTAGNSSNGPVVIPGNAAGSPIIRALAGTLSGVSQMPASGSVTQSWKNKLYIWINQGASNNAPPPD